MLTASLSRKRVGNAYVNSRRTNTFDAFSDARHSALLLWISWLCIGCLTLFFISILFLQTYRAITTSKFFSVERITIHGSNFFSKAAILSETQLELGANSLAINISGVEKTLGRNPWVKSVSVKRKLPGAIDIFITEHKPVFWVLKDGLMRYADSFGREIALVEPDNFVSLPTLEISDNGEILSPMLEDVLHMFQTLEPIGVGPISLVKLSDIRGLEIVIEDRLTLWVGTQGWRGNLKRLQAALSDLSKRGDLKKVSQVISSAEGVWVRR